MDVYNILLVDLHARTLFMQDILPFGSCDIEMHVFSLPRNEPGWPDNFLNFFSLFNVQIGFDWAVPSAPGKEKICTLQYCTRFVSHSDRHWDDRGGPVMFYRLHWRPAAPHACDLLQ